MSLALDVQSAALLRLELQAAGGDVLAAFASLCTRISPGDLDGEPFEAALARAVAALYCRAPILTPVSLTDA